MVNAHTLKIGGRIGTQSSWSSSPVHFVLHPIASCSFIQSGTTATFLDQIFITSCLGYWHSLLPTLVTPRLSHLQFICQVDLPTASFSSCHSRHWKALLVPHCLLNKIQMPRLGIKIPPKSGANPPSMHRYLLCPLIPLVPAVPNTLCSLNSSWTCMPCCLFTYCSLNFFECPDFDFPPVKFVLSRPNSNVLVHEDFSDPPSQNWVK